ncbi:hypothetical protein Zmor_012712 [Zophobas morio]|uniref:Uncharacterized protein n=1 Tax=Zophobas morio TaxID=2755281 RepID=A0AA38IEE2_9CUCU|nr:hypothetical protein Zmor_012712 [Zophobas morio]
MNPELWEAGPVSVYDRRQLARIIIAATLNNKQVDGGDPVIGTAIPARNFLESKKTNYFRCAIAGKWELRLRASEPFGRLCFEISELFTFFLDSLMLMPPREMA